MTDKEILEKAYNKAYYHGSILYNRLEFYNTNWQDHQLILSEILSIHFAENFWGNRSGLIYSKYLWNCHIYFCAWKYHLQKMVLEKEPLKYLEKFLPIKSAKNLT